MRSTFKILLILYTLIFVSCKNESSDTKIYGVKVYDYDGDLHLLFDKLKSTGINTLFVSPELASRNGFMDFATQNDMPVYLIVPTFYNPSALAEDSTLYAITSSGKPAISEWVHFICPNRENYRRKHIRYLSSLVDSLSPEGLSIDFIRYFVYWEKVYPQMTIKELPQTCFCKTCLEKFQDQYEVILPEMNLPSKAEFILTHHEKEWIAFKCRTISGFTEEISSTLKKIDADLKFNLHFVPWLVEYYEGAIRKVAGQDLDQLAPLVDYISPMCYTHMLKRDPSWVNEIVRGFSEKHPHKILPSIQVENAYLEKPFSPDEFNKALNAALEYPSHGVIFWSWDALENSKEKMKIVEYTLKQ